jgi:hypothetical protein
MKLIDQLKSELKKHLISVGVRDTSWCDDDGENPYCDCSTEDECEKRRIAVAKLIKELE